MNAHVVIEGYGTDNGVVPDFNGAPSPAGPVRPVAVSLPEPVTGLPRNGDGLAPRAARLLPLSAKSGEALGVLAGRYLELLDGRAGEIAGGDAVSDPMLSDMAWTAGVGRSHLAWRTGVVFRDAATLRQRLEALAAGKEIRPPANAGKAAFAYPGELGRRGGMGAALYEREPVVRAVLDRCEAAIRDERSASLLDAMFGPAASEETLDDPAWAGPATYALGCALTALWASLGVRPSVVFGHGAGEMAAAQAAGVFALEVGLRLAAAPHEAETTLDGVALALPSVGLVNGDTGRLFEPGDAPDAAYWRRRAGEAESPERWADALAELGVDAIVGIGSQSVRELALARDPAANGAEPPVLIESPGRLSENGGEAPAHADAGFLDAVAKAYEAGLPISFEGLFAGESRRRIALPGYPFQRRSHWLKKRAR